jgi:hypothetical protein
MKERHRRQTKGGRTMQVGRRRTQITDDTMGHRRRIKGGPMITRHRRHRLIATETEIVTETQTGIVIAITIVTGIANRIITCTLRRGLLLRCLQVSQFWCA